MGVTGGAVSQVHSWAKMGQPQLRTAQIGLRNRNSPTCTLSQNGYGARSCLIRAILTFMDPANLQADSILRSPQAVPHASTNRALCRLSSEVSSDPAFSACLLAFLNPTHNAKYTTQSCNFQGLGFCFSPSVSFAISRFKDFVCGPCREVAFKRLYKPFCVLC